MRPTDGFLVLLVGSLAVGACRGEVPLGDTGDASTTPPGSCGGSSSGGGGGGTPACITVPAGSSDAGPGTPVVLATLTSPAGLAIDAQNLYVASLNDAVYAVPLSGGAPVVLDGINSENVAVNSTTVFSVSYVGENAPPDAAFPPNLVAGCAKTGCCGSPTTIAADLTGAWGVAADDENVYFTTPAGVFEAPVGGGPTTALSAAGAANEIVVSGGRLFYVGSTDSNPQPASLLTIPTTGGTPTVLVSPPANGTLLSVLAVDCTNVYFEFYFGAPALTMSTLGQVPVGGGPVTVLATGQTLGGLGALAVDAANVYFLDGQNGAVRSVPIGGGPVLTLATTSPSLPVGIAVDADNVYWTEQSQLGSPAGGTVMKLAKP